MKLLNTKYQTKLHRDKGQTKNCDRISDGYLEENESVGCQFSSLIVDGATVLREVLRHFDCVCIIMYFLIMIVIGTCIQREERRLTRAYLHRTEISKKKTI